MSYSRRKFVKDTGIVTGGIALGAIGVSSCSPFSYAEYTVEADRVIVAKDQFGDKEHVLIKMPNLKKPVYIGKIGQDEYSVLYLECTHKQCTVVPEGTYLKCPCHGSEYDNRGNVTESPAERNLKTFRHEVDQTNIYIY